MNQRRHDTCCATLGKEKKFMLDVVIDVPDDKLLGTT
jgi:hypothetical protein